MKKNVKALIACCGALVLAGGGYAALMLTDDKESTSSVTDSTAEEEISVPVPLFAFEHTDVESITVKNSSGEYSAVPSGTKEEDGTVSFTIKGYEDLEINDTQTSSLLNNSTALNSDSTAEENPSDLAKYGLDKPQAEVTVKASTGEKTLLIGNVSPIEGETYCMEKGGNAVYLAGTAGINVFLNNAEAYISTTLLEQPAEGSEPIVKTVKLERENLDYDIVINYDESADDEDSKSGTLATHYMSEPIFAYLDSEKSQDASKGLLGLSAQSVLAAHPSDDEIKASGLDNPFCTVTMKTDKPETNVLKLGKKLDIDGVSYYPAMFDENDVIYAISADSILWADLEPGDITSKMIFGTYVWDIGTLEIDVKDGEKISFKGNGTSSDDYKVTKNGEECDTERFRNFYTFLLKTSAEDFVIDEEPNGNPIVSISLETQDKKTSQTIEFYQADGKKALISVNGIPCFKCRMSYVDLLIDNMEKFDTDEDFVMNW